MLTFLILTLNFEIKIKYKKIKVCLQSVSHTLSDIRCHYHYFGHINSPPQISDFTSKYMHLYFLGFELITELSNFMMLVTAGQEIKFLKN